MQGYSYLHDSERSLIFATEIKDMGFVQVYKITNLSLQEPES